ncbi:MAG: hypothetical protein ACK5LN_03740 [Propioniciclava sp.]
MSVVTAMATGAALGSVVPGPGTVVGAVAGVVIGAGVAIIADGAVDSFFENGPDVGKALSAGRQELGQTLAPVGEIVGAGVDTVRGWFE